MISTGGVLQCCRRTQAERALKGAPCRRSAFRAQARRRRAQVRGRVARRRAERLRRPADRGRRAVGGRLARRPAARTRRGGARGRLRCAAGMGGRSRGTLGQRAGRAARRRGGHQARRLASLHDTGAGRGSFRTHDPCTRVTHPMLRDTDLCCGRDQIATYCSQAQQPCMKRLLCHWLATSVRATPWS